MSESSTSSSSASANQFSSESAVDSDSALGITVYPLPLQQPSKTRRSGRLKMILVLLVCALPLVASYFTYYVVRPQARNNYGQLIAPQRPLPNAQVSSALAPVHNIQNLRDLKGQWLLLSASGANCGVGCERNLYLQRQLREALGREKERIDWVWLINDDKPIRPALHSALQQALVLRVQPQVLRAWLPVQNAKAYPGLYVVDPMGNLMMHFADDFKPKKALKDLERLLRASASWDTAGRTPPTAR